MMSISLSGRSKGRPILIIVLRIAIIISIKAIVKRNLIRVRSSQIDEDDFLNLIRRNTNLGSTSKSELRGRGAPKMRSLYGATTTPKRPILTRSRQTLRFCPVFGRLSPHTKRSQVTLENFTKELRPIDGHLSGTSHKSQGNTPGKMLRTKRNLFELSRSQIWLYLKTHRS